MTLQPFHQMIPIAHCHHHWLLRAPWPSHSPQQVNNLWWRGLLVAYLISWLPLFLSNRLLGNTLSWKPHFPTHDLRGGQKPGVLGWGNMKGHFAPVLPPSCFLKMERLEPQQPLQYAEGGSHVLKIEEQRIKGPRFLRATGSHLTRAELLSPDTFNEKKTTRTSYFWL